MKAAGRRERGREGSGFQFAGSPGSFSLFFRGGTIRLCLMETRGGSALATLLLLLSHNFSFLDITGRLKKLRVLKEAKRSFRDSARSEL